MTLTDLRMALATRLLDFAVFRLMPAGHPEAEIWAEIVGRTAFALSGTAPLTPAERVAMAFAGDIIERNDP